MRALTMQAIFAELFPLIQRQHAVRVVRGLLMPNLDADAARDVRRALDLHRFRGYRPGHRPSGLALERALLSELAVRSRTLVRFLYVWPRAYPDAVARVRDALLPHLAATGLETPDQAITAGQRAGLLAGELGLPLEDVIIAMASLAIAVSFAPQDDAIDDSTEAEGTNMSRDGDTESTSESSPAVQPERASAQPTVPAPADAPDRWASLLTELEQLPVDSPEWARVEAFAERAVELVRRNLEKRARRRPVAEQLSQLLELHEYFTFFEMVGVEQWDVEGLAIGDLDTALAQLSHLVAQLGNFRALRQKGGSTWKTESATVGEIISTFASLAALFAPTVRALCPSSAIDEEQAGAAPREAKGQGNENHSLPVPREADAPSAEPPPDRSVLAETLSLPIPPAPGVSQLEPVQVEEAAALQGAAPPSTPELQPAADPLVAVVEDEAALPSPALEEVAEVHGAGAAQEESGTPPVKVEPHATRPLDLDASGLFDEPSHAAADVEQGKHAGDRGAPVNTVSAKMGDAEQPAPVGSPSPQPLTRPAEGETVLVHAPALDAALKAVPPDIAVLAKAIQAVGADAPAAALSRLVWELMRARRTSLAYHLQRSLEESGRAADDAPSSVAIRAVVLSPFVHTSYGEIVDDLRETIRALSGYLVRLVDADALSRIPGTLLLYGFCLRPALLAPGTGAAALFEQLDLHGALSGLNALRSAILRFGRLNFEITPSVLKGVRSHAAWEAQIGSVIGKCETWRERAKLAQILYAPATHVWGRWLEPKGHLSLLLDIVAEDRRERVDELSRALAVWSTSQHIDHEANKTDRDLRPDARKKPIEARARERLQSHVKEAIAHMREWLDLVKRGPLDNTDAGAALANQRRVETLPAIDEAERAILDLLNGPRSVQHPPLEIACACASIAISDLKQLFDPDAAPARDARRREALNYELLALPGLAVDPEWNPPHESYVSGHMLDAILAHVQRGPLSWKVAFLEQCQEGNHDATSRILDLLEKHGTVEPDLSISELRRTQERDIGERRARLGQALIEARAAFERAIAEDLFAESEILGLQDTINQIRAEDGLDFASEEQKIVQLRARIDARRQQRIDEVWARLEGHAGSAHLATIEEALANGNLVAANEYIAMIERGEAIQAIKHERDPFLEFFPEKTQAIQQLLERNGTSKREVARVIGRGESIGPFEASAGTSSPEQLEETRAVLLAWIQASQYDGSDPGGQVSSGLITVFKGLGFRNVQFGRAEGQSSERMRVFSMQAEVIREALTCIIPQYGSLAGGRYRVLCMWKGPSEEELVELVGSAQHHDRPIIVVYFGRLSPSRRRTLAVLCRQRHRTFLLLDETLLFFLGVERGLRLPSFFACTFPFTVVDPYTTTAGLVPAEMFFGRGRERRAVFESTGTNLVYGGRQLGKTALLRDVERRYHAPDRGVIVRWIDLKFEGIGLNRPIQDLWVVIIAVLHKEGVISRTDYGPDGLSGRIVDWLEKDVGRRIVLLLDESDTFLKSDAETREDSGREAFPHLWRLKGVMDKTSRRFKVVFAGLHNVQRTSRDVNSPLAHLGAPICIGPLLENGEWQEARRLITMPFHQLGYRFESDDLPMRILAHANWYPSLIQLFCKHLLEHLTHPNRASFSAGSCPPYTITAQHIEEAYQSQDLRKAIVDRFRWTLDLDPRYRVVALCILFESTTQQSGFITGFSVQRLRELALYWWESGFKNTTTIEGFRTILDEMIGLGLLRKVGGANYALRSPNVVNLFGKKDEIELALLDASQHQPPPEYEAATFRRALPQTHKRSPFTAQQESELLAPSHGVSMIFGAKPSGFDDAVNALAQAAHASQAQNIGLNIDWQRVGTAAQFRAVIGERTEKREEGLSVFVVPASAPWTVEWVAEAALKLNNLTSSKKFVRIIFMADPRKAWAWAARDEVDRTKLDDAGVDDVVLAPWHESAVHRWLIDVELGSGGVDTARFEKVTGNWGGLLHEVARRCDKNKHQWERHLEDFEKELVSTSTWLNIFELQSTPLPVLEALADIDTALDLDELCSLATGLSRKDVERSMEWAESLAYVKLVGVQQWMIDPLLGRLLALRTA